VGEVERLQHRDEIVHRQHRALVDDDGFLLPILVLAVELRSLAGAVVPTEPVKELCDGQRLGIRRLAEAHARLSGRREKEDAVLRECLGQHQRTHDRRLARAGPADENAQPSRQQPFERNRLFLDRLAMQLVPLVELAACLRDRGDEQLLPIGFTGAAGLPARLPRTERSRSSRPFSSVSCSAAVDVAPAPATSRAR
jgi:hypothetical protein